MLKRDKKSLMTLLRATPEFKPAEVMVAEEVINSYLGDSQGSGYQAAVAELNSALVGYICYGPAPLTEGTWDIYWIAVAPQQKGRGIGSALMAYAEAKIKEGGRLIIIETSSQAGYEKTRRFYLGHGYELIARIPDFYTPGDDKIILQKRLA
jgi:ribosomal protein S18 acetylase RimI-like enzyme